MPMIMKIPLLLYPLLSLFLLLLLLLFHDQFQFHHLRTTNAAVHPHHRYLTTNKRPIPSKFDFSPFLTRRHLRHRHRPTELPPDVHTQPGPPGGSEIDPRYGVEKRLVPSGPNPLHH
ncbi:UNVERIFIED_CONTAM: CLAVATA3/ESR (CLE)-related protein 12 [Sesamum radiatum]|uniref:CLAVATA3/ESR (CLE)-related protein 12 n=1 Tax=Sesamum radiatum TaxID=300843 RepID=A0AAW2VAU2_SESRA